MCLCGLNLRYLDSISANFITHSLKVHATSPDFTLDQFLSNMKENYGVEITMVVQVKSYHNNLFMKIPIVDFCLFRTHGWFMYHSCLDTSSGSLNQWLRLLKNLARINISHLNISVGEEPQETEVSHPGCNCFTGWGEFDKRLCLKNLNFYQVAFSGRGWSNPASCALFLYLNCSEKKSQTFVIFIVQAHIITYRVRNIGPEIVSTSQRCNFSLAVS